MHSYAEHEVSTGEWKHGIESPHHIETRGTSQERLRRKRMLEIGEAVAEVTQWLLTEKFLTLTNEVVTLTHTHKAQPLNVVDKNVKFCPGTGYVVEEAVIRDPEYETEPMRGDCEDLVNEAEAELELPIFKVRV
jgi:hypothetical protein